MEGWNTTWLGMPNTTGSTKILGGNEFTRKIDYNKRYFFGH